GRVGILRRGELVTLESVASLRAGAPRRVRLSAEAAELPQLRTALEALPGISGIDTQPASAEGTGDVIARYAGPPAPLLALVSSRPITDLVLAEPDLEEAVLAHYSSSSSGTATPDGRQET